MTVSDYLQKTHLRKGKQTSCKKPALQDACCPASKSQTRTVREVTIPKKKWREIRTTYVSVPMQFEQLAREMEVKVYTGLPSTETFRFLFDYLSEKRVHNRFGGMPDFANFCGGIRDGS